MALGCFMLLTVMVGAYAEDIAECGGKPADVFFVLDSSGSIQDEEFKKELRFTEDVVSMFQIGEDKVRVGVLSFSKTVTPQFGLGDYVDRADLFRKISQVTYEGLGTNTGEALSYLHTKGLSPSQTRPSVPHIAVVLTDGMSQDMPATLREAKKVHEAGITVFVIGIGRQVDKIELEAIGSRPSSNYVFMIDSFDALNFIKKELAIKACKVEANPVQNTEAAVEEELTSSGRCTPRHPLDIVFAVDTAGIGVSHTKYVFQFIANMSVRINMAAAGTTITTVGNGCGSATLSEEPASDPEKVLQDLYVFEGPPFHLLMRNMRLKAADGRMSSDHVGVIFATDRLPSAELRQAQLEMMRARFQKISIFVLGIGQKINEDEYRGLITNGGAFMSVPDFEDLDALGSAFLYKLCVFGGGKK